MSSTFAAIDFETAKSHHICSVGIVTFKDGVIVDEFHALIQPPNNDYNFHNIQVHGITEDDTRFAPNFKAVYPEIKKRISGITTVAHNESFDRTVLQKTMTDYNIPHSDLIMEHRWECTLKLYRNKGYKPAKLDACCKVHNIALKHHDALSDARACGKLFLIAQFESLPLF
ncbi:MULTISPECIES: 3'-5' exonuclease [Olleya]|uniref:DNA polymerase-3 subunit epsilon n=1 Tax=Olleya namhaensis TaxID=1144750 RepID=A0A1I3PI42_9FLAO|nr:MULTISPECIES: 3'-5' exonuclease [Olleya]PKG51399.1 DNA polymerase III subunit epsilon [Olleya sp. 1-3]SFJ20979.1 DNA polymerase-3 subunit epsilon [Olleya namhaensis]